MLTATSLRAALSLLKINPYYHGPRASDLAAIEADFHQRIAELERDAAYVYQAEDDGRWLLGPVSSASLFRSPHPLGIFREAFATSGRLIKLNRSQRATINARGRSADWLDALPGCSPLATAVRAIRVTKQGMIYDQHSVSIRIET